MRAAKAKPDREPAERRPVARVSVEVPLAHLDRPFDYLVAAADDEAAQPGVRVKVRFAGQLVNGFLLERAESSPHGGRLAYLDKVVSPERVLDPEVARLARAVADRYAGNLSDVLRLAVPPRHARVESQPSPTTATAGPASAAGPASPGDPVSAGGLVPAGDPVSAEGAASVEGGQGRGSWSRLRDPWMEPVTRLPSGHPGAVRVRGSRCRAAKRTPRPRRPSIRPVRMPPNVARPIRRRMWWIRWARLRLCWLPRPRWVRSSPGRMRAGLRSCRVPWLMWRLCGWLVRKAFRPARPIRAPTRCPR
nr:hypothetical protein GCM10020092_029740 [Actinoplanes digitatis]